MISAKATRDRWLQMNGLTGVNPTQTVLDGNQSDAGPANRYDYAGTTPMQWWRLDGAGHTVPSQTVLVNPSSSSGIQNRDIEFAEVVWAFFKARLPGGLQSGARLGAMRSQRRRLAPPPRPHRSPCPGRHAVVRVCAGCFARITQRMRQALSLTAARTDRRVRRQPMPCP
jgi:hypothetical protein